LGMPSVCVGQDSWQWKENPKVEAMIQASHLHGELTKAFKHSATRLES
jgi:hypothetical protein